MGTLPGRLPQELRLHGVRSYEAANRFLESTFVADFNRRFGVAPRERGNAFTSLGRLDLRLLVSARHERLFLQLPPSPDRIHYARCPVLVHELVDGTLAVSFHGTPIARSTREGTPLSLHSSRRAAQFNQRTSRTAHGADFTKCFGQFEVVMKERRLRPPRA